MTKEPCGCTCCITVRHAQHPRCQSASSTLFIAHTRSLSGRTCTLTRGSWRPSSRFGLCWCLLPSVCISSVTLWYILWKAAACGSHALMGDLNTSIKAVLRPRERLTLICWSSSSFRNKVVWFPSLLSLAQSCLVFIFINIVIIPYNIVRTTCECCAKAKCELVLNPKLISAVMQLNS